jgi:phage protein U
LTQQYLAAANMEGEARIKALDEYIQRVVAIQQQFQGGVMGEVFGKPEAIIAAKDVMEDASADVNRALNLQRATTDRLADAQQNMADEAAAAYREVQEQARNTLAEIERLQTMIADISALIAGMQKTIELTGVDKVSPVINEIIAKLAELHRLAQQPINLGAVASAGAAEGTPVLDSYATGTSYVPRTGVYQLHQGEAVIPATENKSRGVNINGDIVIHVPASAAADRPEDWRMITRQYIVPELRKLQ